MQVTLIFLVCFVSMTWQQDVWLPIPIRHFPFHPRSYQLLHHGAFLPRYGPNYGPDYLEEIYFYPGSPWSAKFIADQRSLARTGFIHGSPAKETSPQSMAVASRLLNPNNQIRFLSRSSTSIVYVTSSTTVSITSTAVCYTSTMFTSTTACRRKRMTAIEDLLVPHDETLPVHLDTVESSSSLIQKLPKQGSGVNLSDLISTSFEEPDSNGNLPHLRTSPSLANRFIRQEEARAFAKTTVTTTITSYSVSVLTIVTTTNTFLGASKALTCLPSGYLLC